MVKCSTFRSVQSLSHTRARSACEICQRYVGITRCGYWTSLQKSCNIVVQSGRRLKHFPFPAVLAKRFLIEKRVTYTSQARNGVELIINTKHTNYLLQLWYCSSTVHYCNIMIQLHIIVQ